MAPPNSNSDDSAASANRSVPSSVDISLPFFGDKLDDLVTQINLPITSGVAARGDIGADPYLVFQAEMLVEMAAGAGITDSEVDAEFGGDVSKRGIQNWGWVLALARLVDRKSPETSGFAIETFLRDFYIYITNNIARGQIDALVQSALTAEPTIVVAHSLGTVVAYNILRTTKDISSPAEFSFSAPDANDRCCRESGGEGKHRKPIDRSTYFACEIFRPTRRSCAIINA